MWKNKSGYVGCMKRVWIDLEKENGFEGFSGCEYMHGIIVMPVV